MSRSLRDLVVALGGDLYHGGQSANVPAPGHSHADRSVSLLLDGDRVVIHGFGSADWRAVRAYLHGLGLINAAGCLTGGTAATSGGLAAPPRPSPRSRIAIAQALWTESLPLTEGDLCYRHFRLRGVRLRSPPDDLRRHPAAPVSVFRETGLTYPALMAAIRTPDGEISAVEIAYLDPNGQAALRFRLPRKMVGSAPAGVAVRLSSPTAEMVVGEGVATTLSAMARFDLPGWALMSAGNLSAWTPPGGVRRVLIAADRGEVGQDAAERLRRRLSAFGLSARIRLPNLPFGDWNEAAADRASKGRSEGAEGRRSGGDGPGRPGGETS
jgi:putative DNA primase/helicase